MPRNWLRVSRCAKERRPCRPPLGGSREVEEAPDLAVKSYSPSSPGAWRSGGTGYLPRIEYGAGFSPV